MASNTQIVKKEGGKQIVETTKFGIFSKIEVLREEDPTSYEMIMDKMLTSLKPADDVELAMVENIVSFLFRVNRIRLIEMKLYDEYSVDWKKEYRGPGHAYLRGLKESDIFGHLNQYEINMLNAFHKTLRELAWYKAYSRDSKFVGGGTTNEDHSIPPAEE